MFNRRKLKKLRAENEQLLKDFIHSHESLVKVERELNKINGVLNYLSQKVDPKVATTTITVDAIMFAQKLQRHPKRKICGMGPCTYYYQVPADIIDTIAKQKKEENGK